MKKQIFTACMYTVITAVILGIGYPLAVTGLSHLFFREKADGQLILRHGEVIGSHLIGQPFAGPGYFHGRPSAAGAGYDAANSSGSNLGPSNKALMDRVAASVKTEGNGTPVPIDLVTSSGSGLDPDISPAAASYQVARVAKERQIPKAKLFDLVNKNITPRQLGLLGEPRVNVLHLNLALDQMK